MSDHEGGHSASKPKHSGPVAKTVRYVLLGLTLFTIVQTFYHPPEVRPVIACRMPVNFMSLTWVKVWSVFVYDEPITKLQHAQDVSNFEQACRTQLESWDWMKTINFR